MTRRCWWSSQRRPWSRSVTWLCCAGPPRRARPPASPWKGVPHEQMAALVRGVLVRLHHRRRLARGCGGGGGPRRDRPAGARGLGERLVAAADRGDRRSWLVAAPCHLWQGLTTAVVTPRYSLSRGAARLDQAGL